jgi:acyl phosphate:glycerol-3-phosphate acyltransferase
MNSAILIILIVGAYLVGSVPVGYLLTHYATGKNIREFGSGNIGSTNVNRIAGKRIALITQLLDMLKGLLPVSLYLVFFSNSDALPYGVYGVALAAILGHDFSVFLKFRGGKGVNTTLGASVLLAPVAVFSSVLLYFIVKWRFKYVSLGSLVLSAALPLIDFILNGITPTFYYLLICTALITVLHAKNIQRLIRNQELPS